MKSAVACLPVVLALGGASAMVQAADDPMDRLRACSTLPYAERTRCLDLLSREFGPGPTRPQSASGSQATATPEDWVVSETTSPVDYSSVVIATTTAGGAADGSGMKLSIACRGGTMSMVLGSSSALMAGDGYVVSYAVDGGSPTALVTTAAPSGTGMALGGDVLQFLAALPPEGEIAFRIAVRRGVTLEGRYSLAGIKATRERMAVSCRWSVKSDRPRK